MVLLLIARYSTSAEVGIYAIAFSIVVILISVQEALVTRPYTIHFFDSGLSEQELAGGTLLSSLLLSAITCIASLSFFMVYTFVAAGEQYSHLIAALSFAIPFALLRQFVRKYLLANVSLRELFFFDLFCTLLVLCPMYYLAQYQQLNTATAFYTIAISYSVTFAVWLALRFKRFKLGADLTRNTILVCWKTGKWLLPTRLIREFQGYMTHWFSIILLSASATGVFAANLSVVALSNPIIQGLLNVMTPSAVRTYKDQGLIGLRNHTITNILIMFFIMVGFCSLIYIFGESIMNILVPGKEYQQNNSLLLILAGAISIGSVASPISVSLVCAGYAKQEYKIYFFVCIVSLIAVPVLVSNGGLTGAALSVLFIEIVTLLGRLGLLIQMFRNGGVDFSIATIIKQVLSEPLKLGMKQKRAHD